MVKITQDDKWIWLTAFFIANILGGIMFSWGHSTAKQEFRNCMREPVIQKEFFKDDINLINMVEACTGGQVVREEVISK